MSEYNFNVQVDVSRPVSSESIINILERIDGFLPAALHRDGDNSFSLHITISSKWNSFYAEIIARGRITEAFKEELGDDIMLDLYFKMEDDSENNPEPLDPAWDGDVVNHPSHYTAFPVEVIELTEHLNFCRGNAVKYLCRAGLKNPDTEIEDLEKASWYIQREIERVKSVETR